MDEHKFKVGERIAFRSKLRVLSTPGPYRIVACRPPEDGEPSYRIKSDLEPHDRIGRESELRAL